MRARSLVATTLLAGLAGCASCDKVPGNAVLDCNQQPPAIGAVKTDILFVVDDSGSMQVEQANIAANFQAFIQNLTASPVKNDFQIGVTTSSVDRNGGGNPPPPPPLVCSFPATLTGCIGTGNAGHPYPAGALVYTDPSSVQSTTASRRILTADLDPATLVSAFVQNVKVGTCGSGKEQPLRAMRNALSEPLLSGPNAGFLRPGARLAVVIVTDDDDCSDPGYAGSAYVPNTGSGAEGANCETYTEDVADFVSFLQTNIGGEDRDPVVGVIASFDPNNALTPGICNVLGPTGNVVGTSEYQALRLNRFVSGLGANAFKASICSQSFHDALQNIAEMLVPQTFPLDGAPADWRMLSVARVRGGVVHGCSLTLGTPGMTTADAAIYTPPQGGGPPTITMVPGGGCELTLGDAVQIQMVCAH
jgi:hypothetical protein